MATTLTPTLPAPEELELADYKIGSFCSDLDALRSTLERCADGQDAPAYDRDTLARIVVFATDVLLDLDSIYQDARAIQATALTLHHEQFGGQRDPAGWSRYQANVRGWHEQALAGGGD